MKITEQNVELEHKFHLVSDDFCIPSHGIIGKDFIKRFKCLIDYGNMTVSIRNQNSELIVIPIKSELLHGVSAVPPRSETFKIFHIRSEHFPCLIEAQEFDEGVVVPTTLVYEPKSWLRVLNTNEYVKIINTNNIKTSRLDDFHVIKPHTNEETYTTNRQRKLRNILRKRIPEFMRDKMLELCPNFFRYFSH